MKLKKKRNESLALLYLSLLYADDTATSVLNINNGHSRMCARVCIRAHARTEQCE